MLWIMSWIPNAISFTVSLICAKLGHTGDSCCRKNLLLWKPSVNSIFHWLNLQHIHSIHKIAAVNPLFHFTQNSKPCGKDHSLSSLWFDISFYYFLPLGSVHSDGRMTWRANTGTKWPSSASMAKAQSRAATAVKVMMQWKPFASCFRA